MKLIKFLSIIIILICLIGIKNVRADAPHQTKLKACDFKKYNNYNKSFYYKNDKILIYWNTINYKACFIKQA